MDYHSTGQNERPEPLNRHSPMIAHLCLFTGASFTQLAHHRNLPTLSATVNPGFQARGDTDITENFAPLC